LAKKFTITIILTANHVINYIFFNYNYNFSNPGDETEILKNSVSRRDMFQDTTALICAMFMCKVTITLEKCTSKFAYFQIFKL